MHYLLFYEVADGYEDDRIEFRASHLAHARKACDRGELILAGAFRPPALGAALLFRAGSAEVAEEFARNDPYVRAGLVKRWEVREWTTVVGEDAEAGLPDSSPPAG